MGTLLDIPSRLQRIGKQTVTAYTGNWKAVSIHDNGEPLLLVPPDLCHPYYAKEMKLISDERLFLREEVLRLFLIARRILNNRGYDLKLYDGWRSIELQEELWWNYMREFPPEKTTLFIGKTRWEVRYICEHLPDDMRARFYAHNQTYVSLPSRDASAPSPHATGGALDVWLYRNGEACDLGVPFDWMEETAGAFYHFRDDRQLFNGNDRRVCRNRELLLDAMIRAGFSSYAHEIWHFNYGNQMDALVRGDVARYSYIEP